MIFPPLALPQPRPPRPADLGPIPAHPCHAVRGGFPAPPRPAQQIKTPSPLRPAPWKKSFPAHPCCKVHRLEKSTLPPVMAAMKNMR